ncbi:hypothetical protein EDB85DRAFT_312559 [Lactarius pseudohatsudake]|nr:hypothetical protein EDB85DRAFT_312559 [Lactarius pseudohatsudake]
MAQARIHLVVCALNCTGLKLWAHRVTRRTSLEEINYSGGEIFYVVAGPVIDTVRNECSRGTRWFCTIAPPVIYFHSSKIGKFLSQCITWKKLEESRGKPGRCQG